MQYVVYIDCGLQLDNVKNMLLVEKVNDTGS